jgi:hypothetical protein
MSGIRTLFSSFMFLLAFLPAAGLAAPVSESRQATGVSRIEIRVPVDLSVRQGDAEGIVLTAEPDVLKRIQTSVESGTLTIDETEEARSHFWQSRHPVKGIVTVKTLNALQLMGTGSVDFGPFKTGRLELSIAGAGNLQLTALTADELAITIAGTGHVVASGTVATVDVHVSGIGEVSLEGVAATVAHVSISGSGNVKVAARDRLDASISGFGEIKYRGSPSVTKSVSGLGTIASL